MYASHLSYNIRKLPALLGLVSRVFLCTARHRTWQAENPISWRCTDLLVKPRCMDSHGKRACGFPISRICTEQHGRSLFIWIITWHRLWSSILHDAAHGKHRAPLHGCARTPPCTDLHGTDQIRRCTDLHGKRATRSLNARNCMDSMQLPCHFHVGARHCTAVS